VQKVPIVTGRQAWIVSGHKEAQALYVDPRVSADRARPGFPFIVPPGVVAIQSSPHRPFLVRDDPDHNRIRRMLISDFTVRRFKELRPDVEKLVHDALDTMLDKGSPSDLVPDFSLPIPSLVISRLLGVPYEDHEFFQRVTRTIVQSQDPQEAQQGIGAIFKYLTDLAADPPPGLIARLKEEYVETGALAPEELVPNAFVLLVAGHETTASMLSLSVITLLEHPEELARFRADPHLAPTAVDELLRYLSIVDAGPQRIAIEDIEIGGVLIKAGDGIVIASSVVNRDPEAFEDPDRFDIGRENNHHLSFAYGVHQCLGQNLARMELQVALAALFERIPTLRLAVPVDQLELRGAVAIQGVNSLPVEW
jgi:pentalenic acid synthase